MRKMISFSIAVMCLLSITAVSAYAEEAPKVVSSEGIDTILPERTQRSKGKDNKEAQVPLSEIENRELIVKGNVTVSDLEALGLQQVDTTNLADSDSKLITMKIPSQLNYEATLLKVKELEGVEFAEPNVKLNTTATPNDYYYSKQWYLPATNVSKAWDSFSFKNEIKVAVIDSGVDASHPELAGKVLKGYDFVNNDSNPADDHGHGTAVAGIIAAIANNGDGVAGINPNVKIIPIKISDSTGEATVENAVKGIHYAMQQGADIINMSYGSAYYSDIESEALWAAFDQGITLIAAAGNSSTSDPFYPASYTPVISVSATNKAKSLASFSNRGDMIDVAAPGEEIYALHLNGGYVVTDGTSFSSPVVAGIASLLKSKDLTLSPMYIEWALGLGASNGKWIPDTGYGIVDAYNSLQLTYPSLANDVSDEATGAFDIGQYGSHTEKIDHPYDSDVYYFNVPESTTVDILINGFSTDLDLYAEIVRKNGTDYEVVDYIDNYGFGEAEDYTFNATAGDYYLVLYDYYNHWSSTPYTIYADVGLKNINLTTPTSNVQSGSFNQPFDVQLKTDSVGKIIYTLDGSTPSATNGVTYRRAIPIYETTNIKAATVYGTKVSEVASYKYELSTMQIPQVSLPTDHSHPIARVIIRADNVGLYKKNSNNTYTLYRNLSKDEQIRVYGVLGHQYNVGGPYYIRHQDTQTSVFIGRALIKKPTALLDPNGKVHRTLQVGEAIRVYSYDNTSYHVGGGYTIKADSKTKYLIGYVKPKRNISLYSPQGAYHSTLKAGNLYQVSAIANGKMDLGNGYYVKDSKSDFEFIKN